MAVEKAAFLIKRGSEKGFYVMDDVGGGFITDIQVSGGVETSNFYFAGPTSQLLTETFIGQRLEMNLNFTLLRWGYFNK